MTALSIISRWRGEMILSLDECRIIEIPSFTDSRGSLSVLEGSPLLPFEPRRMYFLYEIPANAHRGCHAHKTEREVIMAMAGSFKVAVNDGSSTREFELKNRDLGLYVPALVWRDLYDFSPGAVCAVVASNRYDPDDYYRIYEEFIHARGLQGI